MDLLAALKAHGGIARTRSLLGMGITRYQLQRGTDCGMIVQLRRGVYCAPEAASSDRARAAAHGGALTCVSALMVLGVWLLNKPTVLHVELGRGARTHAHARCTCRTHHTERDAHFGVVDCHVALIAAAACLSDEDLFVAFESAWRLGLLDLAHRQLVVGTMPWHQQQLMREARGDADSGLESVFRYRLLLIGIALESQVHIEGIGRVDFRHGRVLIEIDGKRNHEGPSKRHKDLQRDAAAARLGYRVLRFDYAMIVHDWPMVEATVRAALR